MFEVVYSHAAAYLSAVIHFFTHINWSFLLSVTLRLLEGFRLNCLIFGVTLLFAIPLGLVVAFCSMSRFSPLRALTKTLVWIIRGSPLMLQVIIVYYGPGLLWGAQSLPRPTAAIIAFVINYAAYFFEIFRGGIEGIPRGQYEAAQVLGMTRSQAFFKVILLQVVKRIVPPMGNEIITLVKDTSLARIIANKELIMMAQEYISSRALIWPLFYSIVFFLVFNGVLTLLLGYIEKKLDYFRV
jgi:polar amino acid transport system permease protein